VTANMTKLHVKCLHICDLHLPELSNKSFWFLVVDIPKQRPLFGGIIPSIQHWLIWTQKDHLRKNMQVYKCTSYSQNTKQLLYGEETKVSRYGTFKTSW